MAGSADEVPNRGIVSPDVFHGRFLFLGFFFFNQKLQCIKFPRASLFRSSFALHVIIITHYDLTVSDISNDVYASVYNRTPLISWMKDVRLHNTTAILRPALMEKKLKTHIALLSPKGKFQEVENWGSLV